MLWSKCSVWVLSGVLVAVVGVARADDAAVDRLNRIFYWQVADTLKLAPDVEKKMVEVLEDLHKRRLNLLSERDALKKDLESLSKDSKAIEEKRAQAMVQLWQRQNTRLVELDVEETKRLQQLLNPEQLLRFYGLRENMTERVRDAIRSSGRAAQSSHKK